MEPGLVVRVIKVSEVTILLARGGLVLRNIANANAELDTVVRNVCIGATTMRAPPWTWTVSEVSRSDTMGEGRREAMLRLTGSWSQTKYCLITTRLLPTLTTAPPPVITSNIPSNGEHVFVLRRNVSNGDGGGGEQRGSNIDL